MGAYKNNPELIWDEYKYRHTHCWKIVFQLTAAVVLLSIVPYIRPEIAKVLGPKILLSNLIAIVLSIVGFFTMWSELKLFKKIKKKHRKLQEETTEIKHSNKSFFEPLIIFYLSVLITLVALNAYIVWKCWLPYINNSLCS